MTDIASRSDKLVSDYMLDTMRARGVTQEKMAAATGRAQSYIANHLHGRGSWGLGDLERLAPLFGAASVTTLLSAANDHLTK